MFRLPPVLDAARSRRARVTVLGTITEVDPDHHSHSGADHQIFSVRVEKVMADANRTGIATDQVVNVAVRYGDTASLPAPIPGLAVGKPITLCGAYVPVQLAYPEDDGDQAAVIHFTHHPLGWVEYQSKRYE